MARGASKSDFSKADRGNDKAYNPKNFRQTVEANVTKKQAREAQRAIDNSRSEPERDMVKELTEKKSWVPKNLQEQLKAMTPMQQTNVADAMLSTRRQFEKDGTSAYDIYEEEMESQEDADNPDTPRPSFDDWYEENGEFAAGREIEEKRKFEIEGLERAIEMFKTLGTYR
jgi:hypothetical protein